MANGVPSFITGANARLRIDGLTFAYAQDVSYAITVDTVPVETMGRYEAVANEPVNYTVRGEFSIVRYTAITSTVANTEVPNNFVSGNGIGSALKGTTGTNLSSGLNPGSMLGSSSWDLTIWQKVEAESDASTATTAVVTATVPNQIIHVSDCRLTGKSGGLNKRGIWVERFTYVGVLASDDSYTASPSGDIDLSSA